MKKYFLMTLYSLFHNGKNRKEIFVRSLFFIAILYIFSKLWQATQFSNQANQQLMVWYLMITELITLSIPLIQVDIENDIRSGDVVYQLLKPVNYLWLKISDSIGAFFFRFFTLMLIAIPFCTYLSGTFPSILFLTASLLTAVLAGLVFILFQTAIGLSAFKLQDSTPLFWIWQRSSFLFGGMLLPLDFYPWYLKSISFCLPFAALLYSPARLILDFNIEFFFIAIGGIFFWGFIAMILSRCLFFSLLKSLKINGG